MGRIKNSDILRRRFWRLRSQGGVKEITLLLSKSEKKILEILADGKPRSRYRISAYSKLRYQKVHPTIKKLVAMNLVKEVKGHTRGNTVIPYYTLSLFGLLVTVYHIYLKSLEKSPCFKEFQERLRKDGIKTTSSREILRRLIETEGLELSQETVLEIRNVLLNNKKVLPELFGKWEVFTKYISPERNALSLLFRQIDQILLTEIWYPDHPGWVEEERVKEKIEEGFISDLINGALDWEYLPELILMSKNSEGEKYSANFCVWSDNQLLEMYIRAIHNKRSQLRSHLCLLEHLENLVKAEVTKHRGENMFWLAYGHAMSLRQHYPEAIDSYNKILEKNPDDFHALLGKAFALYELATTGTIFFGEQWEKWDEELRGVRRPPNKQKKPNLVSLKEALRCINKALDLNLSNEYIPPVCLVKALVLEAMHRDEEAVQFLDRALEIDPKFCDALRVKIFILTKLEKWHEALQCYSRFNKEDLTLEDWREIGKLNVKLERYKDSVKAFRNAEAIAQHKESPELDYIRYDLASVHAKFKNFNKAIELLKTIPHSYVSRAKEDEKFADLLDTKEFLDLLGQKGRL